MTFDDMEMNTMRQPAADVFVSADYWLSAALLATRKSLVRLDWRGGRAYFCFSDAVACQRTADGYWAGDLQIGARDYANALRTLKDRLRNGYGNENEIYRR